MTFTVFLVTELNQICRLLKAATVHCPGWIIYTRIEMTSGKRWQRRDKDNSDRVKGTLDWEEKLLLVRDSNAMVVIQRLKLMMALTDSEACVCLSTFLQVQLSTLLKFFCYATHKLMTYSRKAFRGKKKKKEIRFILVWHYLKASLQLINVIWLVLKTTDSKTIRTQPCDKARIQRYCCAGQLMWLCTDHLWSLICFTSPVYD